MQTSFGMSSVNNTVFSVALKLLKGAVSRGLVLEQPARMPFLCVLAVAETY